MSQRDMFVVGEGAAWLKRNEAKLTGENDPVAIAIDKYKIKPKRILEVGCSNGWRLDLLRKKFRLLDIPAGIDPCVGESGATISAGKSYIEFGTAEKLNFRSNSIDLIIYGWCLYLTDPEDYFKIAMEGDRVLADGGYLIVYDFHADYPYKTPYKHKKGLFSYHYDFSKLWLSHPAYTIYGRTIQGETSVTILRKNLQNAFPVQK